MSVESEAGAPDGTVVCSFSAPRDVRLHRITAGFSFYNEEGEPIVPPPGNVAGLQVAKIDASRAINPLSGFSLDPRGPKSRTKVGVRWLRGTWPFGEALHQIVFGWQSGIDIPFELLEDIPLDGLALLTLGELPPNANLVATVEWIEYPLEELAPQPGWTRALTSEELDVLETWS